MKWVLIVAFMIITMQSTHAAELNIVDYLLVEKTKAQALALQVKTEMAPAQPEYRIARQKYTGAQQAFNNYTKAMLSNYKAGNRMDLKGSAQLAASSAQDFENYVSNQKFISKGGSLTIIFATAGFLLEIGERFLTFIQNEQISSRDRIANGIALQVTWDDWDRIGSL